MDLTGDASGGSVQSIIRMFTAAQPPNSFCFSLEGFSLWTDADPTSFNVRLEGWSGHPEGEEITRRQYNLPDTSKDGYATDGSQASWLPVFLGYRVDGQDGDVRVYYQTNNDTKTYLTSAWGEFWLEHAGEYIGAQQPAGSPAFEASRPVGSQGSMIDIRAGRPPPQVPAVELAKTAAPFRTYDPDVVPPLAAGTPTKPSPAKPSPSAAQDPYAALRRAYVQTLAAMGKRVATIPGTSVDEINSNFFSLRTSVLVRAPSTFRPDSPRVDAVTKAAKAAEPPVSRSSSRSGAKSATTNPTPVSRIVVPAPVASPTFSATRFAIQRLNIAALNKPSRSAVINPTGGGNKAGSNTRRDIFENEG